MRPTTTTPSAFRAQRGFTLVELMVALTGGLFLSVVVFALSRDATRFYQREGRIAGATLSSLSGFERLTTDIARAGHLSTANITADPSVCVRPDATWPAGLRSLRGLVIETDTTLSDATEVGAAGIKPQGIVIAGALSSGEMLITMNLNQPTGGAWQFDVKLDEPAAARVGLVNSPTAAAANTAALTNMFMSGGVGRIVRLRSPAGMDQYAVVGAVNATATGSTVTLANSPTLARNGVGDPRCGVGSNGERYLVSVVDIVRYNIRSMVADSNYAALFRASGALSNPPVLPYEPTRAELVRVELAPDGTEIAATREIVGEYAVDLQLNAWGATSATNPTLVPVTVAIGNTYAFTQYLRGVHVRLSTRSREADREADVMGVGGGNSADRYRVAVGPSGTAPYARVRTLQTDVPLRNMEKSNW